MIVSRIDRLPWVTPEERQLVVDNYRSFLKAYWTGSGEIDGVPEEITDKIVAGCASAGGSTRSTSSWSGSAASSAGA